MSKTVKPVIRFHFMLPGSFLQQRTPLKQFLIDLFEKEKKSLKSLDYIFCNDEYLLEINQKYLSHDDYTDIITFDLSGGDSAEGEIYISIDLVRENALRFQASFQQELLRVIFHGALHLCGYKDKTDAEKRVMREREDQCIKAFLV
ncbi:MAG: rRNA maturation RNase YbeY [Chitinophagaceae bacterium]|nr:rRNA maturation RNase YbeY [Chitinophagaceae bacterium]